ncbi:MAG: hypothetical protein Q3976_04945 [Corynebacterium sp.]|nr:hypothetical protein [Corynebacterium sp.]
MDSKEEYAAQQGQYQQSSEDKPQNTSVPMSGLRGHQNPGSAQSKQSNEPFGRTSTRISGIGAPITPDSAAPDPVLEPKALRLQVIGEQPNLQDALEHRRQWHTGIAALLIFWLFWAGLMQLLYNLGLEISWWLRIHSFTIAVIATAIMAYSAHFAEALSRKSAGSHRGLAIRILLLNFGFVLLVCGRTGDQFTTLSLAGSLVIAASFSAHGYDLYQARRHQFATKNIRSVSYYITAVVLLVFAICASVSATYTIDGYTAWIAIHSRTMIWGFVWCTIIGTLITFYPTIAKAKISPTALARIPRALTIHVFGLALYGAGQLVASSVLGGLGLSLVAIASVLILYPALRETNSKGAAGSTQIQFAIAWMVIALLADAFMHFHGQDPRMTFLWLLPVLLGCGIVPLILAVLGFTIPALRGGGPEIINQARSRAATAWRLRMVLTLIGGILVLFQPLVPIDWLSWYPRMAVAIVGASIAIGVVAFIASIFVGAATKTDSITA